MSPRIHRTGADIPIGMSHAEERAADAAGIEPTVDRRGHRADWGAAFAGKGTPRAGRDALVRTDLPFASNQRQCPRTGVKRGATGMGRFGERPQEVENPGVPTDTAFDCGSYDAALASCAVVLGVNARSLERALRSFEYDDVPDELRQELPYEALLPKYACGIAADDLPVPAVVHWYHGTRVLPGTDFSEGLLSLDKRLDGMWQLLRELAAGWLPESEAGKLTPSAIAPSAFQYPNKVSDPINYGPHAVLVREVLFRPRQIHNHDYLRSPEIVDDICAGLGPPHGPRLHDAFVAATKPCIVKFRSRERHGGVLRAALMYVHRRSRGEDLCRYCNTCYDGPPLPIPPADIISVEWPPESELEPE